MSRISGGGDIIFCGRTPLIECIQFDIVNITAEKENIDS